MKNLFDCMFNYSNTWYQKLNFCGRSDLTISILLHLIPLPDLYREFIILYMISGAIISVLNITSFHLIRFDEYFGWHHKRLAYGDFLCVSWGALLYAITNAGKSNDILGCKASFHSIFVMWRPSV